MLLIFGVLAFGAVETWATSILEIGSTFCSRRLSYTCRFFWRSGEMESSLSSNRWVRGGCRYSTDPKSHSLSLRDSARLSAIYLLRMLVFVITQIAGNERSSRILVLTFIIFGSALALFAICQNLSSTLRIYWLRMPRTEASIFGPYVNHNHYAGLMEMLTPLAVVLSLSTMVQGGQRILAAFAAVLMAGSLVLSLSRGGAVSLVVEFWFYSGWYP